MPRAMIAIALSHYAHSSMQISFASAFSHIEMMHTGLARTCGRAHARLRAYWLFGPKSSILPFLALKHRAGVSMLQ